jgi:hypothetical protein
VKWRSYDATGNVTAFDGKQNMKCVDDLHSGIRIE